MPCPTESGPAPGRAPATSITRSIRWARCGATHACGAIGADLVGSEVVVAGWVQSRRDHGGVIFVDLRDREGLVRWCSGPKSRPTPTRAPATCAASSCSWRVATSSAARPETVNPKLPTGEVEVAVRELRILNVATPPPFRSKRIGRRRDRAPAPPHPRSAPRAVAARAARASRALPVGARDTLQAGFPRDRDPILARATPEGARDFLVPSRLQPGEFYALPQSPQIMKQLLMIAGFERYFQIARASATKTCAPIASSSSRRSTSRCLRRRRRSAGRTREVTVRAWRDAGGIELERPFARLSYADAMARYGSDKPDTRVLLELVELTDLFRSTGFRAFGAAVQKGGVVKCLPIHDADALTRGEIDRLESFVKKELGGEGPGLGARQCRRLVAVADRESSSRTPSAPASPNAPRRDRVRCSSLPPTSSPRPTRSSAGCAPTSAPARPRRLARVGAALRVEFPVFERDEHASSPSCTCPSSRRSRRTLRLFDSDPERMRARTTTS